MRLTLFIFFLFSKCVFSYIVNYWYAMVGLTAPMAAPLYFRKHHTYFNSLNIILTIMLLVIGLLSQIKWYFVLFILVTIVRSSGRFGVDKAIRIQKRNFAALARTSNNEYSRGYWKKYENYSRNQMVVEIYNNWQKIIKQDLNR